MNRNTQLKITYLISFILIAVLAQSQTETLNNQKIKELVKVKLGDATIINLIHSSPGNYDCSASGIVALKKDSVSEDVINEIIRVCNGTKLSSANVSVENLNDSYKPTVKYGPVNQEKLEMVMREMRPERDEFQRTVSYFSNKTPRFKDDQDRLYAYVLQTDSGKIYMKMVISHVNVLHSGYPNISIQQIILKADTSTFAIKNRRMIFGNGTRHAYFDAGFSYNSDVCVFVKKIIASSEIKVRFEEAGGTYLDFKVSEREKKALNDVVELYKAMRGIND